MEDIKPTPVVETTFTRNILFLTNSELGQCNVALAVAEEFLHRDEFRVHFASYSPLAPMVEDLNKRSGASYPAQFHEIWGPCMTDLAVRSDVGLLFHRAGVKGAVQGFKKVKRAITSWTPTEYARAYNRCVEILDALRPAVVIIDPILHVGLDACRTTKSRVVVLWPVPIKDVVVLIQPKAGVLWKYPVTGSGYPFPVPCRRILQNTYLFLRIAVAVAFNNAPAEDTTDEKTIEGRSPFPLVSAYSKESLHLTPSFQKMDFPFHVPDNVVSCGPILRQCEPLAKSDPDLAAWLSKPTILISLGSHVKPTEKVAVQMAKGIQTVLTERPYLQVLWKLRYDWQSSNLFVKIIGSLVNSGAVKIVPWIESDIIAVLETGQIITYVHHGGANSYFEACKVGVPQIVLPQWLDTYDCATRVEWLGIGVHGSRSAAPGIDAGEFAKALLRVLRDESIHSRSLAMKGICKATEGRVVAHDRIVEFALN
ncbi:hypothetical protein N7512_005343 [Penicillium capsulatum]|nr:hypothetical protein N7512_005343 [Penicillium capsulatum]